MPKITTLSEKQSKSITSNLSLHDYGQPQPLPAFIIIKHQNNSYLYQDNMVYNQTQYKTKNRNQNQQDSDRVTHFKLEHMKMEVVIGVGDGGWWCWG